MNFIAPKVVVVPPSPRPPDARSRLRGSAFNLSLLLPPRSGEAERQENVLAHPTTVGARLTSAFYAAFATMLSVACIHGRRRPGS